MKTSFFGFLLIAALLVAASSRAAAEDHRNDNDRGQRAVTLSGQLQYGISTNDSSDYNDANPYGFGFGARGGITLVHNIYLGIDFDYFIGENQSANGPLRTSASGRVNVYDILGEVGYDAAFSRSDILRPKIGFGLGMIHGAVCGSAPGVSVCDARTEKGFAFEPGLQFLHFFGAVYLTLDARYQIVIIDGPDPSAVVLGVGIGVGL